MKIGLGDAAAMTAAPLAVTTTVPLSSVDLYMAGLKVWGNPGAALSALGTTLSNFGAAVSGSVLPATLGLWTPPLALAAVVFSSMSGRRRR